MKKRGAVGVLHLAHRMMLAVELHDDLPLNTAKVDDEGANGMLSAEFEMTKLPRAQVRP